MKPFMHLVAAAATVAFSTVLVAAPVAAAEAPDALVKRISNEVIDSVKADKDIQSGNRSKIMGLVNEKILPYVDAEKMTQQAAGRHWRTATPEQKQKLTKEFRDLLVYTYAGALSTIKNETVEFKPMRGAPTDTDVEVRSQVNVARGEPITLNYRLSNEKGSWKIYDVNVLGAWLVQTYTSTFNSEISKNGVDGLIKRLADRNAQLASKPLAAPAK
ncbi:MULTISPECIES: MlaC/ttg2D family ABC transporter substrate-binding protein [Massilia]|uniref:Signal peptide protein n=2 Tax=Massilia TaxID=149698 RepID=A0A422QJE3_9BURK|nr:MULTISPECIES: ABC transporter substrate-binding protein [Massilia]MDY0963153.1 ABC transporter substrate-binding protein [Massilia sp. CFBP9026]MDY0975988.1 ABC transporter substrate-binding protein [Massilia sp. CFBP9012]RNF30080.1 signal peptide protein [Massilia aurea]TXG01688.1 ABC transporter substrate-binding protein [Massilia arenae]